MRHHSGKAEMGVGRVDATESTQNSTHSLFTPHVILSPPALPLFQLFCCTLLFCLSRGRGGRREEGDFHVLQLMIFFCSVAKVGCNEGWGRVCEKGGIQIVTARNNNPITL